MSLTLNIVVVILILLTLPDWKDPLVAHRSLVGGKFCIVTVLFAKKQTMRVVLQCLQKDSLIQRIS